MKPSYRHLAAMTALATVLAACSGPEETVEPEAADTETTETAAADSREGLGAGVFDAEQAAWNVELTASVPPPPGFFSEDSMWFLPERPSADDEGEEADTDATDDETAVDETAGGEDAAPAGDTADAEADADAAAEGDDEAAEDADAPARPGPIAFANTDLAFSGDRVFMGNFHGFNIYDASAQDAPEHVASVVCPGGQGDVSVHGDLVFHSVEQTRARLDCGAGGVEGDASPERFMGIRIFDVSDVTAPVQVAAVQTCRGSHTHTLVPHPSDDNILYIYVQGTGMRVRPDGELQGCVGGEPDENPDTALYSIDIIEVPLDAPENAAVIARPRIFEDAETGEIAGLWAGGASEEGSQETSPTVSCHDITVYPEMNLAAGACSGNGILLDISDPANPVRIDDVFDPNMAYWHSATFNNDATKVVFTDEWGGGLGPRCRPQDPENWGANIVVDITADGLERRGYFKIPGTQTEVENCVAHNGSLIPVPGRDIMVQGWYSGGLSVIDFTDSDNVFEIAYFDRGPVSEDRLYLAGYWAAYWHNGRIWAPEIVRGLDVLRLLPSEHLSEAEIAAAEMVTFQEANPQTQLRLDWPAEPVVAQAYLDQLVRAGAIEDELAGEVDASLQAWADGSLGEAGMLAERLRAAAAGAETADAARLEALADQIDAAG